MEYKAKSIKDMEVFKLSHKVNLKIYDITSSYPKHETYGLISQMRRCSVSVNSNLVEGAARATNGEFKQFIGIARGSAAELEYQIELSKDLGFLSPDKAETLKNDVNRILQMLSKLLKSIK